MDEPNHADATSEVAWRLARPRRIAVRIFGWIVLAGAVWAATSIAASSSARRAILEWGTFGLSRLVMASDRGVQH